MLISNWNIIFFFEMAVLLLNADEIVFMMKTKLKFNKNLSLKYINSLHKKKTIKRLKWNICFVSFIQKVKYDIQRNMVEP